MISSIIFCKYSYVIRASLFPFIFGWTRSFFFISIKSCFSSLVKLASEELALLQRHLLRHKSPTTNVCCHDQLLLGQTFQAILLYSNILPHLHVRLALRKLCGYGGLSSFSTDTPILV